ncbi:glycosyltransferase family 4 protein [Candidatus Nomurabacteria bacterium]|nr:glycosyltransferase family 4 protein [Candidatus Nomurabacteria bacterium]
MQSSSIAGNHPAAMLCKGDDGYGVASVLKLYARNAPELQFVCLQPGTMFDWLKHNGNRVHLVKGLSSFTATSSARTLMQLPAVMTKAYQSATALHKLFQQLGIRVVHAHWLPQHIIAGHLRKLGYASVWHIHGNMSQRRLFGLGTKLNHRLAQWGADLLIPVSDFIGSNWKGAGVPIRVIHNAAPKLFEGPNERRDDHIRCVIAGRLTEDKGHHLAIQAVLNARAAGHDVRLDVFGGPLDRNPYVDDLNRLVSRSNAANYVRFMGFADNLREQHQLYDLGLQCRLSPEPCSMWVCETLVDGLPLIAADAGGTAELIEDEVTGVLFSSGDVSDLTSKLLTLIENRRHLNMMRSAAYERGRHLFGVERFISETYDAYAASLPRSS